MIHPKSFVSVVQETSPVLGKRFATKLPPNPYPRRNPSEEV